MQFIDSVGNVFGITLSIIGIIGGVFLVLYLVFAVCKFIDELWTRGTWLFRIVFMILPAVAMAASIIYGIVRLWMAYTYETTLITSVLFYFSAYFTGYRQSEDGKKEFLYRRGAYAQFSRCVFIAPWSPFIFVYLVVKFVAVRLWKLVRPYLFKVEERKDDSYIDLERILVKGDSDKD